MYTLYKFHFLNGISEINQIFDDILIIWPAPVYLMYFCRRDEKNYKKNEPKLTVFLLCFNSVILQLFT